tara:strand:+ start:1431 stop:1934 length:504 start_codon:yes stop_codon:yes gene_type:complete
MKDCFALSYKEEVHPSELFEFRMFRLRRVFVIDHGDRQVYGPTLRPILIDDDDITWTQLVVGADRHWFDLRCPDSMGYSWQDFYNGMVRQQRATIWDCGGSFVYFEVVSCGDRFEVLSLFSPEDVDIFLANLNRSDMDFFRLGLRDWEQEVAAAKERIAAKQAGAAS